MKSVTAGMKFIIGHREGVHSYDFTIRLIDSIFINYTQFGRHC